MSGSYQRSSVYRTITALTNSWKYLKKSMSKESDGFRDDPFPIIDVSGA